MRRIISLLLMLTVCVLCTSCGTVIPLSEGEREFELLVPPSVEASADVSEQAEEEEGEMILLSVIESEPVLSGTSSSDPFVKTLKATVLPDTAYDKYVTWSIAWSSDATTTEAVTDYVTVVPTAAGSTTATVTCLQPFDDTAVITVKTRAGGYTAKCTVSYLGAPETISIDLDALAATSDVVDGDKYIQYGWADTGSEPDWISVSLDNRFESVGDDHYSDIEFSVEMHGGIYANCKTNQVDDGETRTADAVVESAFIEAGYICVTFQMPESSRFSPTGELRPVDDLTLRLFKLEENTANKCIGITGLDEIFVHDDNFTESDLGFYSFNFTHGAPSEYSCVYFTLTLTHASTGVSTSIDLVLAESASSVTLDESNITF